MNWYLVTGMCNGVSGQWITQASDALIAGGIVMKTDPVALFEFESIERLHPNCVVV